jgi:SET and MYND domain-containing protein
MILDFLESWNDASSEDFTELLTEFEVDCARFVLDGLVRLVLQQTNTRSPDRTSDGTFSHADTHSTLASQSGALENVKPTGYWSDLLHLQNNELEHVKSKPYMLGVFIRVYAFLRFVALSTLSATSSTKRSRGRKGHGMANDTVEAAPPKQDAFLETLVKLLETSEGVRAILARDHGNVFGIWEKGSPSDSNGEDDSSDSEMLGWGMYVFGSYFNHGSSSFRNSLFLIFFCSHVFLDCTPTVRKTQHSRSLCFTSTRDIAPGEELCINYIDVSKSNGVMKRNEELSKEWFFECGCARCERERKELA